MASLQTLSPLRAILYAAIIFLSFFALSRAIQIPDKAAAQIESMLRQAGFSTVSIGQLNLNSDGITAEQITLDQHGFDKIGKIDIRFSWPAYLMGQSIQSVEISNMALNRDISDFSFLFQKSMMGLLHPSDYRLVFNDAQFDVMTGVGDLRFIMNASIDPAQSENDKQKISAHIIAQQFQLGFDSKWSGTLSPDGTLEMASDIVDGRLHFGEMRVTRFNGWIGLAASQKELTLQSQMDAGGAHLFDIPMQDISLVTDITAGNNTVVFRSSMAGMNDVSIMADMAVSEKNQAFNMTLSGRNFLSFLKAVETEKDSNRKIPAILSKPETFSLSAEYQAERRFVGGPLPFALNFTLGDEQPLSGNFLIYPDNMDIRGSAEAKKGIAPALRGYFDIPEDRIQENFIRLDGDLKQFFTSGNDAPADR